MRLGDAGEPGVGPALVEAIGLTKRSRSSASITDISLTVHAREVVCVVGEDGAGKSTLVKTIGGVHQPDSGRIVIRGETVRLRSPRDAMSRGIASVHQGGASSPLLSVTRAFFLGSEPTVGLGPFRRYDRKAADRTCRDELLDFGLDVGDPRRPMGSLSPADQRAVVIARALYRGDTVVLLDEPTATLAGTEVATVLRHLLAARARGLGILLASHRLGHAYPIGDRFIVLERGTVVGTFAKRGITQRRLAALMGEGFVAERLEEDVEADTAAVARRRPVPVEEALSAEPSSPTPSVSI